MSKFKPIKVDFVALYFKDWLTDFLAMGLQERGAHDTLCLKIYNEGGRLPNKPAYLASLCGIPEEDFEQIYNNIILLPVKEWCKVW
jgi:uncharacterized protein YdaU (DUF1376 family)